MSLTDMSVRSPSDWLHVACQHDTRAWPLEALKAQLVEFPGWSVAFDAQGQVLNLWREYRFANFEGVKMAVHALMHLADDEDHHPEAQFGYQQLTVRWSTHSAQGISNNDWACAAKLDDALRHIG